MHRTWSTVFRCCANKYFTVERCRAIVAAVCARWGGTSITLSWTLPVPRVSPQLPSQLMGKRPSDEDDATKISKKIMTQTGPVDSGPGPEATAPDAAHSDYSSDFPREWTLVKKTRESLLKSKSPLPEDPPVTIYLSPEESKVLSLIAEFRNSSSDEAYRTCEIRASGGWVRDHLMAAAAAAAEASNVPGAADSGPGPVASAPDIDLSLSNMTGRAFASAFNEWLVEQKGHSPHTVAVIAANPANSKHLETATMRLKNVSLDFVNLRSEIYADSRVPTKVEFGTAEEDALRRDFTANSLLVNLFERSVEDWTGKGFADLEAKVLRTPVDAETTFKDDPLRLLRGIRFAAVLDFSLDTQSLEQARNPIIVERLQRMVSRPRIGQEMTKMLIKGPPAAGLKLLVGRSDLGPVVFDLSSDEEWQVQGVVKDGWMTEGVDRVSQLDSMLCYYWPAGARKLQSLEQATDPLSGPGPSGPGPVAVEPVQDGPLDSSQLLPFAVTNVTKEVLVLAAFTFALKNAEAMKQGKKPFKQPLPHALLQARLQYHKRTAEKVCKIIDAAVLVERLYDVAKNDSLESSDVTGPDNGDASLPKPFLDGKLLSLTSVDRRDLVMLKGLRQCGELWMLGLLIWATGSSECRAKAVDLFELVMKHGWHRGIEVSPRFNGNVVAGRLKIKKGPHIRTLLDAQIELLMLRPHMTDDELFDALKLFTP